MQDDVLDPDMLQIVECAETVQDEEEAKEPHVASRRPHQQDVFLSWDGLEGAWFCCNRTSLERIQLPVEDDHQGQEDEYSVAFDDEGFGVLASETFSADMDDLFKTMVFEDDACVPEPR